MKGQTESNHPAYEHIVLTMPIENARHTDLLAAAVYSLLKAVYLANMAIITDTRGIPDADEKGLLKFVLCKVTFAHLSRKTGASFGEVADAMRLLEKDKAISTYRLEVKSEIAFTFGPLTWEDVCEAISTSGDAQAVTDGGEG